MFERTDHAGGHTKGECIGRNVTGDETAGADDRSGPDAHAWQDRHACADDLRAVTDHDGFRMDGSHTLSWRSDLVPRRDQHTVMADSHAVADPHIRREIDEQRRRQVTLCADTQAPFDPAGTDQ